MEKAESKFREEEHQKPLTIDFSSELARLMKLGTIPKGNPQISGLLQSKSVEKEGPLHHHNQKIRVSKKRVFIKRLGVKPTRIKGRSFPNYAAYRFDFSTKFFKKFVELGFRDIEYMVKEIPKIPRESLRALDEFSYLPVWFTMPVIFVSSALIGATLSLVLGL
jgi:hypothetical protein